MPLIFPYDEVNLFIIGSFPLKYQEINISFLVHVNAISIFAITNIECRIVTCFSEMIYIKKCEIVFSIIPLYIYNLWVASLHFAQRSLVHNSLDIKRGNLKNKWILSIWNAFIE